MMGWISEILSRWKKKPEPIEYATKKCMHCYSTIEMEAKFCPYCRESTQIPIVPSGAPFTGIGPDGIYYIKGLPVISSQIYTTSGAAVILFQSGTNIANTGVTEALSTERLDNE